MNFFDAKGISVMHRLFVLRSGAIVVQLATVLAVYFGMSLKIALYPLLLVIGVETIFHLISIAFFRKRNTGNLAILMQVLADVFFLTLLMSLSGGATNAFVSLLLLPIVIAAVSLPPKLLSIISVTSVVAYSVLLLNMPEHSMHHMDMKNHFIGMWANFLLSVIVVTFVVGALARLIRERERSLALKREAQLRSEQLLALGVASAQVTHQLATPLSTLQLLFDELIEDYPDEPAVKDMRQPLARCTSELGYFRALATSIRENKKELISVIELVDELVDAVALQFPETQFSVELHQDKSQLRLCDIESDAMLLPAVLNLVQNGIKSNGIVGESRLDMKVFVDHQQVNFSIRDYGVGLKKSDDMLGEKLVKSDSGLGMAMLLSNTTLERLGGSLTLENHPIKGAIADVSLPLVSNGQAKDGA